MQLGLFISILSVLFLASFLVAKKYRATTGGHHDFFLSDKNVGFLPLALTFLATQMGGGVVVGTLEASQAYGIHAVAYSLGLSLGMIILAFVIGPQYQKLHLKTIPEIFMVAYHSRILHKLSSLLMIVSFFLILVAIGVSARKFLISVGHDNPLYFYAIWLSFTVYTSFGGLSAIVRTESLQVLFILAVLLVLGGYLVFHTPVETMKTALSIPSKEAPFLRWTLMPLLFVLIGQDMGLRCFAAKSRMVVRFGAFAAGILLLSGASLVVLLGCLLGTLPQTETPMTIIDKISLLTTPSLATFFLCVVIMAIVSTADALLCAVSSNVCMDFEGFFSKTHIERKYITRGMTLLIGTLAMFVVDPAFEVIPVMVFAYEISISALAVPILLGVLGVFPSKLTGFTSVFAGFLSYVALSVFRSEGIEPAFLSLLISLSVYILTALYVRVKVGRNPI